MELIKGRWLIKNRRQVDLMKVGEEARLGCGNLEDKKIMGM